MFSNVGIKDNNFNPRPREGSDSTELHIYTKNVISIHAPVKGATLSRQRAIVFLSNFNPRPREGSDEDMLSFYSIR